MPVDSFSTDSVVVIDGTEYLVEYRITKLPQGSGV